MDQLIIFILSSDGYIQFVRSAVFFCCSGLYTHGKDSPESERSNKMREQRNRAMTGSDSESGISQRRK